ncbi:conserved hypothetical protein; putative signal peptide [Methylobacterium sp. 4-46]|uniref:hypothetical protein n=1 Tax=unclassified Methylobacterium TaxID=2615210 RepID=UPI000165CCB7|nr:MULTISPECIES: hypothetical protein [Methylobacterium]ACA20028.1 conserved hypothetical protein; putative signal peptide [Methylobacterium sp. 4-46]WFT79215.1 hypothetical protein QA634_28970 [Methylobacterium nodulans]
MIKSCLDAALLLVEAQSVVELRLMRLVLGGLDGCLEAQLMVSEKVNAALEAAGTLMAGGSCGDVIVRYREQVADNRRRLAA